MKKQLLALPLLAAALLVGCSSAATEPSSPAPSGNGGDGTFPATVDGPYGEVTVPEAPQRVLSLATFHVDTLVSLGVQPVAIGGASEEAFLQQQPWLEGKYTAEIDPSLLVDYRAQIQAVAKYKPDLIIADKATIPEDVYDDFSQIAPTYLTGSFSNNDMEQSLRDMASLTGTTEKGEQLLADVDARIAKAKSNLGCVQGKTYQSAFFRQNDFALARTVQLELLGLKPASDLDAGSEAVPSLSLEDVEQFNADVLTIGTWANPKTEEILSADPRFKTLPASQNNAVLFVDVANAVAGNGPMGLTWQIDGVEKELMKSKYCTQ